jgi:hypothetical protein
MLPPYGHPGYRKFVISCMYTLTDLARISKSMYCATSFLFVLSGKALQDCLEQSGKKFCCLNFCFEVLQNVDRIDRFIKNYAFV